MNFTVNTGTLGQWGGNGHVYINGSGTATTDGMLGGNIIANGADFASYLATQGVGALGTTNFPAYSGDLITAGLPADNINMTVSTTAGGVTARTINAFRINAGVFATMNDLNQVLTIASGGLLVNNQNATIDGGQLTAGTAAAALYEYQNAGNTLTLDSSIVNNGTTAISFVKSGAGTLTMTPSSAVVATAYATSAGSITLSGTTSGLFAGEVLSGTGLGGGTVSVGAVSGSTIGLVGVTSGSAAANGVITFAAPQLSSTATLNSNQVTVNLTAGTAGWATGMAVGGTGIPAGTTISGITPLSGTEYTLTLSNSAFASSTGSLTYGAPSNSYSGTTVVNQGTLNLTGQVGSVVVPGNLTINNATVTMNTNAGQIAPASNVTVNGGGTLTLVNTNTLSSVTFNNSGGNAGDTVALGNSGVLVLTASNAITAANDNLAYTPTFTVGTGTAGLIFTSTTPTITTSGLSTNNLVLSVPILSTSGAIVKAGTGSLVLSNTGNTFTSGINLNAGTIIVGATSVMSTANNTTLVSGPLGTGPVNAANGTTLMAGGGAQTIYNALNISGNLTFGGAAAANNLTVNGPVTLVSGGSITVPSAAVTTSINAGISGSGPLVKSGPGTLMLNSSAGYTGATYITGGVLKVVPTQAGLFQGCVANGTSSFDVTDPIPPSSVQLSTPYANSTNTADSSFGWSNNTTWGYQGYLNNSTGATETFTFFKNFDDSMLLKIDGNVVINNTAWNVLTTGTYSLTPGEHTIQIYLGQGAGGVGPNISGWPNNLGLAYAALSTTNTAYVSGQDLPLTDPGNGSFLTTSLAQGSPVPLTSSVVMSSNTVFDMSTGGTLAVGSLADAAGGETGAEVLLGNGTLTIGNDNTNQTFSGALVGAGSGVWVTTGGGALVKIGTGTQTLAGSSSYAGGTTLGNGVLAITNDQAIGTGPLTFSANSTLQAANPLTLALSRTISIASGVSGTFDTQGYTMTVAVPITGAGGNLVKIGSGLLALTASNTYTGTTTVSNGTLEIGNGGNTGSLSSSSSVTDNSVLAFSRSDSGLSFGSAISGSGSVFQIGSGTTTMTGSNSYTGGTTVSNGVLQVGNSAALGNVAPLTVVTGGTLNLNGYSPTVGALTGNATGVIGNLNGSSTGTLTTTSITGSNTVFAGSILDSGGTTNLVVTGGGTLALTGTSNYRGTTSINSGTLVITSIANVSGGASSLGNPTSSYNGTINMGSAGLATLQLIGPTHGTNRPILLQGNAAIDDSGTNPNGTTNTFYLNGGITAQNPNLNLTLTGTTGGFSNNGPLGGEMGAAINLGASGSLTKNGPGTWSLDMPNTIGGGTVLNAGILVLANGPSSSALGSGNLTINGGTLTAAAQGGGAGSMSGTVQSGTGPYVIAPGVSPTMTGDLYVGGLSTSSSTTLYFDLGSPVANNTYGGDLLTVASAGPLTIGASTTIALSSLPTATGDYRLLADSNTSTLTSAASSNLILPAAPALTTYTLSTTADKGYLDLVVAPSFTNPSFTLSASAAAHTIISGGTSSIAVTLANLGSGVQPDTILYTGLSATTTTGATISGAGSGSVAPSSSGSYAATFSSSTPGSYAVTPTYLSVSGSNGTTPVFSGSSSDTVNVLGHSNPALGTPANNNQTIITGGTLLPVTLSLTDAGSNRSGLDVSTLSNLSGGTGVGGAAVVANSGTGTYTATGFNTTTVGQNKTLVTSLYAGDQQLYSGASALTQQSQTVTYNVEGHANPLYTPVTLNVGTVHAGYAGTLASNSFSITNGAASDYRANLKAGGTATGGVTLNNLSGIAAGASGTVQATLANGVAGGTVLSQTVSYTLADDSSLSGASSNLGTASIAVTGQVYSGQMVYSGNGANTSWSTGANWKDSLNSAVHAAPGNDPNFTATDSATFDGGTSGGTITLDTASPSLAAITFSNSNANYTIAQGLGGTLTLNGSNNNTLINSTSGMATVAISGSQTISAPILLSTSAAFVPDDTGLLNIAGNIGDGGNNMALVVAASGALQAGSLILSGTGNTYTGGTYVESGTLYVNNTGAIDDGSSLIVGAGGTFLYDPTAGGAANEPAVTAKASDRSLAPVPEPGTLGLLLAALGSALACYRFSKRPRQANPRAF